MWHQCEASCLRRFNSRRRLGCFLARPSRICLTKNVRKGFCCDVNVVSAGEVLENGSGSITQRFGIRYFSSCEFRQKFACARDG